MTGDRFTARTMRLLAALAGAGLLGCTGLMTSVGGGMTPALAESGVSATAQILEVWDTGWTINDSPVIGMKVRVQPRDRPDFEATIEKTTISRIAVPQFQPGNLIPVRFDPQNPAVVAVDPGGEAEAAAEKPATGNPYRDRFERADLAGASFLPPPAEPQLYLGTADMTSDFRTLFEHEYALIGGSSVRNATNPQPAVDHGREIGAAMVVLYGHFVPAPGVALDVLPFPRAFAEPGEGEPPAMRLVSGSVGPDDQFATYWGKTRPAILGIVSRPLDAGEQANLHRKDGIVVETVSKGSPAAAAKIFVGDVITAIDGRELTDPRAVPEIVTSLAGREVSIDLLRGGQPMSVTVALNPATP